MSMEFPKQDYWSRLPFPPPGDLPDSRIEPMSPNWQADSFPLSHLGNSCIHSRTQFTDTIILLIKQHLGHLKKLLVALHAENHFPHGKESPRILESVAYPSPVDLPNPGIELGSPALQADSLSAELPGKPSLSIIPSKL